VRLDNPNLTQLEQKPIPKNQTTLDLVFANGIRGEWSEKNTTLSGVVFS
jgi:hypothetical protein